MFQSIKFIKYLGHNTTTKLHEYEYELVDSDFGKVAGVGGGVDAGTGGRGRVCRDTRI